MPATPLPATPLTIYGANNITSSDPSVRRKKDVGGRKDVFATITWVRGYARSRCPG
jgi:hypothetical protein